jgi:hypothetical protein
MNPPSLFVGLNNANVNIYYDGQRVSVDSSNKFNLTTNLTPVVEDRIFIGMAYGKSINGDLVSTYTDTFMLIINNTNLLCTNNLNQLTLLDYNNPADRELSLTFGPKNFTFYLSTTPDYKSPRLDLNMLPFKSGSTNGPYYLKSALTDSLCFINGNRDLACATPGVETFTLTNLSMSFLVVSRRTSSYDEYLNYAQDPYKLCCPNLNDICRLGGMTQYKCDNPNSITTDSPSTISIYPISSPTSTVSSPTSSNISTVSSPTSTVSSPTLSNVSTVSSSTSNTTDINYSILTDYLVKISPETSLRIATTSDNKYNNKIISQVKNANTPDEYTLNTYLSTTNISLMSPPNLYDFVSNGDIMAKLYYKIINQSLSVPDQDLSFVSSQTLPVFFKIFFVDNMNFMIIPVNYPARCISINSTTLKASLVPIPLKPTEAHLFYLTNTISSNKKVNFQEIYVLDQTNSLTLDKYLKSNLTNNVVIPGSTSIVSLPSNMDNSQYASCNITMNLLYNFADISRYYALLKNGDSILRCCQNDYDDPTMKQYCQYGIDQPRCDSIVDLACTYPNYKDQPVCSCYNTQTYVLPEALQKYSSILKAEPTCWSANCKNNGYKNSKMRDTKCSVDTYCDDVQAWKGTDNDMLLLQETCQTWKKPQIQTLTPPVQNDLPVKTETPVDVSAKKEDSVIQFVKDYPIVWLFLLIIVVALYFALTHKQEEPVYSSDIMDYNVNNVPVNNVPNMPINNVPNMPINNMSSMPINTPNVS